MEKRRLEMKTVCEFMLIVLLIGILTSTFNIQPVKASGTIYIKADGSIDPPDAPIITHDNITYTLTDNITSSADGIVVERSNTIIDGNGFTLQGETDYGFFLPERNNVTIKNTGIVGFSDGIGLYASSNNTISNNTLISNRWFGISIQGASIIHPSNNNTVINNTVTESVCGIQFHGFSEYYNIIENNKVYLNDIGIQLSESARNTTFRSNTISNNDYGLIIMDAPEGYEETKANYGNKIFHNNFIDNTHQAVDNATGNVWSDGYPSGGNYWSDYNGTDSYSGSYQNETSSDGIGDTSYLIDVNNTDRYPLMGMFSDFNATPECRVQTICNSTISDFQYNGTAICFNVSGENDTAGFCRICIPKALMNETYRVLVNGAEILPAPLPLPCSNSTHNYIYFNYTHSEQDVVIIPEFPSIMILPLLMTIAMLTVVLTKKKIYWKKLET
jgi:parallel beta-helix repeat protein